MLGKGILAFVALAFVGYGFVSLFSPDIPVGYIGYQLTNADAKIEVVAMYGGLQIGFGLFCLMGVIYSQYETPALLAVVLMLGGLALSRGAALMLHAEPVTIYTQGALIFETVSAALALLALLQARPKKR